VVQYNLADPYSAYNYATFLSYLALEHGPRLLQAIQHSNLGIATPGMKLEWLTTEQQAYFDGEGLKDPRDEESKKRRKRGRKKGAKAKGATQIETKQKDNTKGPTVIPAVQISEAPRPQDQGKESTRTMRTRSMDK